MGEMEEINEARVYITTVAQQRNFEDIIYETENPELKTGKKEYYPIFNIIRNTAKNGDEVKVIAIQIPQNDGDQAVERNFGILKNALSQFEQEKGLKINLEKISLTPQQNNETHRNLFKRLILEIPQVCDVYADITYGTKPISIAVLTALNAISIMRKYCDVKRIVYGQVNWGSEPKTATLYDVTDLFGLDLMIKEMDNRGGENIEEAVKLMLGIREADKHE